MDELRPTLLLDEMESLDADDRAEILGIVRAGYKCGAKVPRVEGERSRHVKAFEVYAPMALAAIRTPHATIADRAIPLVMQRGRDRKRINAEVDATAAIFTRIRAGCYRLLLTRWAAVRAACETVVLPDWLNARARELWKPLLALAHVADRENGLALTPDLLALAREHVEDREDLSEEGEALFAVLAEQLGEAAAIVIHPLDLAEDLRRRLGWREAPTPERVGGWLRRYGFSKAKPPRDGQGVRYVVGRERLEEMKARYTPEATYTPTPTRPKAPS